MANGNGHGETRLDRIEKLIAGLSETVAQHVEANDRAHEQFLQEHQLLLRAQVVLADNMAKLDAKMLETTEKLDALIKVVDDLIRRDSKGAR